MAQRQAWRVQAKMLANPKGRSRTALENQVLLTTIFSALATPSRYLAPIPVSRARVQGTGAGVVTASLGGLRADTQCTYNYPDQGRVLEIYLEIYLEIGEIMVKKIKKK